MVRVCSNHPMGTSTMANIEITRDMAGEPTDGHKDINMLANSKMMKSMVREH